MGVTAKIMILSKDKFLKEQFDQGVPCMYLPFNQSGANELFSPDNLCKQFRAKSGPTCWALFCSKLFDMGGIPERVF